MNTLPHKLEASIGGYPGPYYDVTLTDRELIYNCHDGELKRLFIWVTKRHCTTSSVQIKA